MMMQLLTDTLSNLACRWFEQHRVWEQINHASHNAASRNSDDFCLSALLTWEKLPLALAGVLSVEAWRAHVYPRIRVRGSFVK